MASATSLLHRWRASGTLRPLLSGSAWSFLMQSVAKASVLLTTLIGARLLGVDDFGLFVALQAIVFVSVSAWDLGVSPMITRDVAAGEAALGPLLRRALVARLWLLPLWLAVFAGGAAVLGVRGGEPLAAAGLFAVAALVHGFAVLLDAGLQGQLRFRGAALGMSSGRLLFSGAALLVVLLDPRQPLTALAGAFLVGSVVTPVVQLLALRRWHDAGARQVADVRGITRSTTACLRRSLPFAMNGFFNLVYTRMDVVAVSVLAGATQAGLYAPASRFQDALLLFPMTGVAALTPIAARRYAAEGQGDGVRGPLRISMLLSLCLTVPPVVAVLVLARPLVDIALGAEFAGSVGAVRILALSMPFVAVGAPITAALIAAGRAPATTFQFATGLVVTLAGLLLLAPRWGAEGAAWAAMSREPIIAGVGLLLLRGGRHAERERGPTRVGAGAAEQGVP